MEKRRKWNLIILVVCVLVVGVLLWWNISKTESVASLECKKGCGYTKYVYKNEKGKCIWYAKVKGESNHYYFSEEEFLIQREDKTYSVERFEAMDTISMDGIVKQFKNAVKCSELSEEGFLMNKYFVEDGFLYYGENEGHTIYWYRNQENEYLWYAAVNGKNEYISYSEGELIMKQNDQFYRVELSRDVKAINGLGIFVTPEEWTEFEKNITYSKLEKVQN